MKTTVKKILLTLSAVLLFAVVLSFNASALEATGECGEYGDNVTWSFDSSTGTLTISGTGAMYYSSFSKNAEIKNVVIEDGVTSIDEYAFYDCSSLESVTIPDSVTSIGSYAFEDCTSLEKVTILNNSLGIYELPSSAVIWCYRDSVAHERCVVSGHRFILIDGTDEDNKLSGTIGRFTWQLDKITGVLKISGTGALPYFGDVGAPWKDYNDYITTIEYTNGMTALMLSHDSYSAMKTVIIPDGVTSIGGGAFENCKSLESVTIPESVTSIGSSAFRYCSSLKSITIPDSVTSIGYEAFRGCKSLENVTIPDGVTSIDESVFEDCSSLESITIPDSVISIGHKAFRYCSLKNITIPNSVTSIGEYAFEYCSMLESITIPDSVTSIGFSTFYGCFSLESLTIPYSVKNIYNTALPGTLKEIYVYSTDCEFDLGCGLNYSNTIYGFKGSTAEAFADKIGARFLDIETIHTKHTYEYSTTEEATCQRAEKIINKCICGKEKIKSEGNPLPHTEVTLKAVAPTYTKTGLTEGKKCKTCGKVTVKQKTVAKKKLKKVTVSSVKSTKAKTSTVA